MRRKSLTSSTAKSVPVHVLSDWALAGIMAACFTVGYVAALWAHYNDIFH
jgi:hypothetical protein